MLQLRPYQAQVKQKDYFVCLTDDPPVYTFQHVEIFFCCHMMSLADIQLVTTPDPAKLLNSQSFSTLYLSSWNAEMNVELFMYFFQTIPVSQSLFRVWFLPSKSLPAPTRLVRCKYTKQDLYSTIQVNNENIEWSQTWDRVLENPSQYILLIWWLTIDN